MSDISHWVYSVERCTTDKLDLVLNSLNSPGDTELYEVTQIQHMGGRDWVVISRIPDLSWEDEDEEE